MTDWIWLLVTFSPSNMTRKCILVGQKHYYFYFTLIQEKNCPILIQTSYHIYPIYFIPYAFKYIFWFLHIYPCKSSLCTMHKLHIYQTMILAFIPTRRCVCTISLSFLMFLYLMKGLFSFMHISWFFHIYSCYICNCI